MQDDVTHSCPCWTACPPISTLVLTVALEMRRRGFGARQEAFGFIGFLLGVLHHLIQITISVCLLPLDNAVLLASYIGSIFTRSSIISRRQSILQNVHFYPKTILITGIDTPHGLSLARHWYYEGHRVVGADVGIPMRSGGSMSKTLGSYYHIPKSQYVSRLLDIINREKVDLWIPCSDRISALEDAMTKQVVDTRTSCQCVHLNTGLASLVGNSEFLRQYLIESGLPVVESHRVQSRDAVHKILHRSPTKAFRMRRLSSAQGYGDGVALPKRTTSMTYSEVSEIEISNEIPWVLRQQTRLGEFRAEMLVIRGHVHAVKVCPADHQTHWGQSRLDEALVVAIHNLMESFARKGGVQMTAHLKVKLMVDEEFDNNSVRHVIHIAECTQGAAEVKSLLQDPSCPIVPGYLGLLSPPEFIDETPGRAIMSLHPGPVRQMVKVSDILKLIRLSQSTVEMIEALDFLASKFLFWRDSRFSRHDPLPWWWHVHIYRPWREIGGVPSENAD